MQIPDLSSQVFWNSALHYVRDRSRHKSTGAVTLWLCHCNEQSCSHAKTPVSLERVTLIPQQGDLCCYFGDRTPRAVVGTGVTRGECYLNLQQVIDKKIVQYSSNSTVDSCPPGTANLIKLPHFLVDYYPALGDEVTVWAGIYSTWVEEEADKVRGERKYPSRKYTQMIEGLENIWWTFDSFMLRIIRPDGMCVIVGDGRRVEVPIKCLRVRSRRVRVEQEQLAA